ncbi:hypothetical protein LXL04_024146 [Taraxacum kok-saghyz]
MANNLNLLCDECVVLFKSEVANQCHLPCTQAQLNIKARVDDLRADYRQKLQRKQISAAGQQGENPDVPATGGHGGEGGTSKGKGSAKKKKGKGAKGKGKKKGGKGKGSCAGGNRGGGGGPSAGAGAVNGELRWPSSPFVQMKPENDTLVGDHVAVSCCSINESAEELKFTDLRDMI